MNNEVYKEVYGHILNDAQRIRKEIMNEWSDIVMFGGSMPDDVLAELSIAARITGLSFDALSSHGVEVTQVNGKPELYTLMVRDERYVCHKTAIPSMSGFLDVVNIPGVSATINSNPIKENPNKEKESTTDETFKKKPLSNSSKEIRVPIQKIEEEPVVEEEEEEEIYVLSEEEEVVFGEEETEEVVEENVEEEEEEEESESDIEEETEEVEETEEEEEEEEDRTPNLNTYNTPSMSSLRRSEMFIDETEKKENEFVYTMFDASLTHSGFSGGGRPMDIKILIAPLKIQKFSCPTVPIIVAVFYKGKILISSSYDHMEDGKNLITMNIDEFYLLFRGVFNADGKFEGFVNTTGISASQGDILNITSQVKYGRDAGKNVNNGHIKFRTTVYEDQGTVEVFPFGDPEDNEFIVMTKTDEFVDYMYIANDGSGLKRGIIYQNNEKVQVNCEWEDEKLKVSLKGV